MIHGSVKSKKEKKKKREKSEVKKAKTSQEGKTIRSRQCQLCHKKFKTPEALLIHQDQIHTSAEEKHFIGKKISKRDLKFPCSVCCQKFVTESLLLAHSNKHKPQDEYIKKACSLDSSSEYRCILCYTRYKDVSHLLEHANNYHRHEISRFSNRPDVADLRIECPACPLKFISLNSLSYHRMRVHYLDGSNFCQLCQVQFRNTQAMITHLRKHKNELEELFHKKQ